MSIRSLALRATIASMLAAAALPAAAQDVLLRARLGSEVEDVEVLPSGRHANVLAIADGLQVVGVPVTGHGHHGRQRLFDVERLGMRLGPRGMAYVESERLFVFVEPSQLGLLFFSDDDGNPAGTREISWPAGFVPGHCEALTYVPRGSRWHPDTIAGVFYDASFSSHVLVLTRDGEVIEDLYVDDPSVQANGLVGLTWTKHGGFLATAYTAHGMEILRLDLEGRLTERVPVSEPGLRSAIEGIGEAANGEVMGVSYEGAIFAYTRELARRPAEDRHVGEGIGLSHVLGPAWDPDGDRFLFVDGLEPRVVGVPSGVDSKELVVDLAAAGYGDLFQVRDVFHDPADGGRIGVSLLGLGTPYPPGFAFFDDVGGPVDYLALGGGILPHGVEALGTTGTYAVTARRRVNNGFLRIVDSTGSLVRSIDLRSELGPVPVEAAYFDPSHPSGGRLLVTSPAARDALVLDLDGTVLARFEVVEALHVPHGAFSPTAITTGPHAGAFGVLALDANELVVFTLP